MSADAELRRPSIGPEPQDEESGARAITEKVTDEDVPAENVTSQDVPSKQRIVVILLGLGVSQNLQLSMMINQLTNDIVKLSVFLAALDIVS